MEELYIVITDKNDIMKCEYDERVQKIVTQLLIAPEKPSNLKLCR